MVNSHVLQAIAALVAQGKTPAMATVKARVSHRAAMRDIIETLQAYKADPGIIKDLPVATTEKPMPPSDEKALLEQIAQLEQQQAVMAQQIHELTQRLNALEAS